MFQIAEGIMRPMPNAPRKVVSLFREAADLDEGDRATLAGLLLESLDQPPDAGVEAAWAQEVERRLKGIDEGKVKTVPWEEVKDRLLARANGRKKR